MELSVTEEDSCVYDRLLGLAGVASPEAIKVDNTLNDVDYESKIDVMEKAMRMLSFDKKPHRPVI